MRPCAAAPTADNTATRNASDVRMAGVYARERGPEPRRYEDTKFTKNLFVQKNSLRDLRVFVSSWFRWWCRCSESGYTHARMNAQRVIADLRELAARTSTPDGAQRLAWGPVWRDAREWFKGKVAEIGLHVDADSAGNHRVTLRGASPKTVIVGSHLDSVPNGGWLDGALGVMAALEALRMYAAGTPPVTLKLVDWADEEGARFGRSLLGSAAAAGSLKVDDVRGLKDRQGTELSEALAENGVAVDRMVDAHLEL